MLHSRIGLQKPNSIFKVNEKSHGNAIYNKLGMFMETLIKQQQSHAFFKLTVTIVLQVLKEDIA